MFHMEQILSIIVGKAIDMCAVMRNYNKISQCGRISVSLCETKEA